MADFESMIRDRLADGTLPKEDCRMTWYGPGTNAICVACDQPIAENEVEVECDLGVGGVIRLHQRCYEFWRRELRGE